MDDFNLNEHSIDDVLGRKITINGTSYLIEKFIAEGGEKWVYSIQNIKSKISLHVFKISKFKPDPSTIEAELKRLHGIHLIVGTIDSCVEEEDYYNFGARFSISRSFAGHLPYNDLINKALNTNNFNERINIYDQILSNNPYHDHALALKSNEFLNAGKFHESLEFINKAIDIESNRRDFYLLKSHIFKSFGMTDFALSALFESIHQFPYDGKVLTTAMDLAFENDRIIKADTLMDIALSVDISDQFIKPYQEKLIKSKERYKKYFQLLQSLDKSENTVKHEKVLINAINTSENNQNAYLLLSTLFYKDSNYEKAIKSSEHIFYASNNLVGLAAKLIVALSSFHLGKYLESKAIFEWTNHVVNNIYDLPKIPVQILLDNELHPKDSKFAIIEEVTCYSIIEILEKLIDCFKGDNPILLQELYDKYSQLQKEMNKEKD